MIIFSIFFLKKNEDFFHFLLNLKIIYKLFTNYSFFWSKNSLNKWQAQNANFHFKNDNKFELFVSLFTCIIVFWICLHFFHICIPFSAKIQKIGVRVVAVKDIIIDIVLIWIIIDWKIGWPWIDLVVIVLTINWIWEYSSF